jgi:hypothetical protein
VAEHCDGAQPARRGLLGDSTGVGAERRKKAWGGDGVMSGLPVGRYTIGFASNVGREVDAWIRDRPFYREAVPEALTLAIPQR